MSTLSVVIPTMVESYLIRTLEEISKNSKRPHLVVVVNNSGVRFCSNFGHYPFRVEILNDGRSNLGVNGSWNLGVLRCRTSLFETAVSILNDDILLNTRFFERLSLVLSERGDLGILCPKTLVDECEFKQNFLDVDGCRCVPMKRREGWAFTLSSGFVREFHPIPRALKTFFGDDWIFRVAWSKGWKVEKDEFNVIYHMVGETTKIRPEIRQTLESEREIFRDIWEKAKEKLRGT